jgi:acetyl/propionyl-CoA carboxylase alpha subunit
MFRKVLIANRGEIALRILRACRTLGVEAVVAYSEADRESLPVGLADEAICIGPPDAQRSYLSAPAVISAALVTGCDAIHPGYGFLSEDEGFAEVVAAHDLTFIGPPATILERFANHPGLRGDAARRHACPDGGRADRVPGACQAVGRRWRQGHEDGAHAARARVGAQGLPQRGEGCVR